MKPMTVKFVPLSIIFGEYDYYAELLCDENPSDWGWGTNTYTLVPLKAIQCWLEDLHVQVPAEDEEMESYIIRLLLDNCDTWLRKGVHLVDLEN